MIAICVTNRLINGCELCEGITEVTNEDDEYLFIVISKFCHIKLMKEKACFIKMRHCVLYKL